MAYSFVSKIFRRTFFLEVVDNMTLVAQYCRSR